MGEPINNHLRRVEMAVKSADQATGNWVAGMQAPSTATKYKQGIQGVTDNPMAKAASPAAQQKYLNRVTDAVNSGRMAQRLNAVPMQLWQQQSLTIGAQNLSQAANKGKGKFAAAAQKWQPIWQQAQNASQAIAHDGSMASAMARVQASMQVFMQAAGRA